MAVKVIAELGINHQGSEEILWRLADSALEAGADFVKLQMRTPRLCVPYDQWSVPKETPWGTTEPYIEYREKMELDDDALARFDTRFHGTWSASVWDIPSLYRLRQFNVPWVKFPSASLTDLELLSETLPDEDGTALLSTGMSTWDEIVAAHSTLSEKGVAVVLMACCSDYPARDHDLNLLEIQSLQKLAGGAVGYSNHSPSPLPCALAVALGAEWIEVHYTLNRTWKGSDHAASLERRGLEIVVRDAARVPIILGEPDGFRPTPGEMKQAEKLRKKRRE